MSNSLNNLGRVARLRGQFAVAERYYRRALDIQEAVAPESLDKARTVGFFGDLEKERGAWNAAGEYYRRSLLIREKIAPASLDTAYGLVAVGESDLHAGNLIAAQQNYEAALAIRAKLQPGSSGHAFALKGLASVMAKEGKPEMAADLYDRAINAIESQTDQLGGGRDVRIGYRAQEAECYREYVALLLRQGRYSDGLSVLERSRAQTLREMLIEGQIEVRKRIDNKLRARLRSLQESLAAKANYRITLASAEGHEVELARLDEEVRALLSEYRDVQAQIEASSPKYAALLRPPRVTIADIQHRLITGNVALVEYMLGSEVSYVFVVTSSRVRVYRLAKRSEIDRVAREVYGILKTPGGRWDSALMNSYRSSAAKLSQMVLAPISLDIAGKRLAIVADGFLNYIPFAALPDVSAHDDTSQQFVPMIVNHEIVKLPSAATLALLDREPIGHKAGNTVAVMADPVFSRDEERLKQTGMQQNRVGTSRSIRVRGMILTRLTSTGEEARRILAVTPPGEGIAHLGFDANRGTVMSGELSKYRIVHFATHGIYNESRPEFSGLMFSLVDERGKARPGFVGIEDIYNLTLPADLVVLSGCDTALGKEVEGEGVVGLTQAFFYTGTSRVLASLWEVEDRATAVLMGWFYEAVEKEGMSPAAALRKTQIRMWQDPTWRVPNLWAAFQLNGKWN